MKTPGEVFAPEDPLHVQFEVPGSNRVCLLGKAALCACLLDVYAVLVFV